MAGVRAANARPLDNRSPTGECWCMRAIRIHATGGPEVMRLEDIPVPSPAAGEVLLRIEAAGVNFIDTYQRGGLYQVALPFTLGQEAAGSVAGLGAGVRGLAVGDRAAWGGGTPGGYAEYACVPAERLVPVPAGVTIREAAAAMIQGMTAHYLTTSAFALDHRHTCLVHAAAGGVGRLLVQMAELRGARVIATVGSDEKAVLARRAGADEVVNHRREDVAAFVRSSTKGVGVDVVYDGIGLATWERSLAVLRPRGTLVLFGNASGPVPPVDPLALAARGSVYLTRPRLADYTADREELMRRAGEVLEWVASKLVTLHVSREYPLEEAAMAHRDLESAATTGKLLLIP